MGLAAGWRRGKGVASDGRPGSAVVRDDLLTMPLHPSCQV